MEKKYSIPAADLQYGGIHIPLSEKVNYLETVPQRI